MAVDLPELPQPGPSQVEIMFRRMLLQCMHRAQHARLTEGGADWQSDPKFHYIVESLQERLYDLEQSSTDRPSSDVLQLYRTHVKAVAADLQPQKLPAYCITGAGTDQLPDVDNSSATSAQGESVRAMLTFGRSGAEPSTSGSSSRGSSTAALSSTAAAHHAAHSSSTEPSFTLSSRAKDQLQTQRQLQDDLANELLDMGQELKASTLAMQNAIRYRGKLLDEAEVALETSTANTLAVAAKAKQQYKQGSWNFCQTVMILLAVTVIFSGMLVYIKLTSMFGLKGRL